MMVVLIEFLPWMSTMLKSSFLAIKPDATGDEIVLASTKSTSRVSVVVTFAVYL